MPENYIENCPECESFDLVFDEFEAETKSCSCLVSCNECDFKAIQHYKVDSWEKLD